MKENVLRNIYNHVDREDIISRLTLEIEPAAINKWLSEKYSDLNDKSIIIPTKVLKQFKEEYLDLYKQIQSDLAKQKQDPADLVKDMQNSIKNNNTYKAKLQEYLDSELDIKSIVKNMIVAIEFRAAQVFDKMQENSNIGKGDYILINYMNSLVNVIDKYNSIINGSSDKIIQQNNINIQILDSHIGAIQKALREVISRFDYDTSLLFIDTLNEELKKLKLAPDETIAPIDIRLSEAKKLEEQISNQLDKPSE